MSSVLVVMPCYNQADTLNEALLSVEAQSYGDFRLICCNDHSTDDTLKVLQGAKERFDFDFISNEENLGVGRTINKCIDYALEEDNYTFITWISSDNLCSPNFLEEHIKHIQDCAITYSGWSNFGGIECTPNSDLNLLKKEYKLGPSFMFRKNLWSVAGPFHELPGEDYYFAVKCVSCGAKFGFVPASLIKYREHSNSVSGRITRGQITSICTPEAIAMAEGLGHIINGENIFL